MLTEPTSPLLFGGDYNSEQWPEAVRRADLDAMAQLGVNTVTLPVFAWALIHPAKDRYELDWLDRVVDAVAERGIGVVMATPTAAQPAWMSAAFPEILRVDSYGRRRRHGGRVNYCPTSTPYRDASAEVAGVLAEHFRGHEALRLWHVNNEYGPVCYCDGCLDGFRGWLAERYGDIATLNAVWGTNVWGNTLSDWSEVELPSGLNAMAPAVHGRVHFVANPSAALDHARFCSATLLDCFLNEQAVLRELTPDVPVTTNFHGPTQTVDWHEWAPQLDVVTWDSYPRADEHWATASFGHDLARGAGDERRFLVMESSPGPVNWHEQCALKRPGRVRLEGLQAVARGSRGVLYFQIRQARAGPELNHAALIPRHGRLDTRMGAELGRLSADLRMLSDRNDLGDDAEVRADIAVVFDWPSWWAHHHIPGLDQRSRYVDAVRDTHRAISERGYVVDVIGASGPFRRYQVVVAPLLHAVGQRTAPPLADYVSSGGALITTVGSGIVGDDGQVHPGGADPLWRRLLGLWVEETDVQPPEVVNRVTFGDDGSTFNGRELFDIVRPESAEIVAVFEDDFYASSPAVTTNRYGDGTAAYVAALSGELVAAVVDRLWDRAPAAPVPPSVEWVEWRAEDSELIFALNHGSDDVAIELEGDPWTDVLTGATYDGALTVPAVDAVVLRRSR